MQRWLWLLIILVLVSGCCWPFGGKARPVLAMDQGVSLEVINAPLLHGTKKIYFMPFSAGAEAEATQALERMCLVMVRGFADALAAGSRFDLVSGDDAGRADMVISGHVEAYKVQGHFKKTVMLKVRGEVRAVGRDEVVARMDAQRVCPKKDKNVQQAFYEMGYSLAGQLAQ